MEKFYPARPHFLSEEDQLKLFSEGSLLQCKSSFLREYFHKELQALLKYPFSFINKYLIFYIGSPAPSHESVIEVLQNMKICVTMQFICTRMNLINKSMSPKGFRICRFLVDLYQQFVLSGKNLNKKEKAYYRVDLNLLFQKRC